MFIEFWGEACTTGPWPASTRDLRAQPAAHRPRDRRGSRERRVPPNRPAPAAAAVLGLLDGLSLQHTFDRRGLPRAEAERLCTDVLWAYLRARRQAMTELMEQVRMREYLRDKGDRLPLAEVRARVAGAFDTMEALLAPVSAAEAAGRPLPGEWSIHEVVDHLVLTHAPSVGELVDLLAGRRPAGPPIPAGLQSRGSARAPLGRAAERAPRPARRRAPRARRRARPPHRRAGAGGGGGQCPRSRRPRGAPSLGGGDRVEGVCGLRLPPPHPGSYRPGPEAPGGGDGGRDGHPRGSRARPGGRGLSSAAMASGFAPAATGSARWRCRSGRCSSGRAEW